MWWNVKFATITTKMLHRSEATFQINSISLFPFEVNGIAEREAILDTLKIYAWLD